MTYLYSRGRYATGESEVSSYQAGEAVGEGVRWSADGKSAWRLHDGEARTFLIWPPYVARYIQVSMRQSVRTDVRRSSAAESTFLIWQVVEPITMDEASAIDARVSSDNLVGARLSDGRSFS